MSILKKQELIGDLTPLLILSLTDRLYDCSMYNSTFQLDQQ
jgi:hypothetical protein